MALETPDGDFEHGPDLASLEVPGAEFAKLCNKPLHVFDQEKSSWFTWSGEDWEKRTSANDPIIGHAHVTGTGTWTMQANGTRATDELFDRPSGA
jgi:hypothetical protein